MQTQTPTLTEQQFASYVCGYAIFPGIRRPKGYLVQVIGDIRPCGSMSGSDSYEFRATLKAGARAEKTVAEYKEPFFVEQGEQLDEAEQTENRLNSIAEKARAHASVRGKELTITLEGNILSIDLFH